MPMAWAAGRNLGAPLSSAVDKSYISLNEMTDMLRPAPAIPPRGDASKDLAAALRAATALRNRIVSGDLTPGTPLREASLATELDVSRNTLREALRRLAAEGLIEQQLYKGAVVRTLSIDEVRDIYTVRRALQLRAIEESAIAPRAAFDTLETALAACEAAAARRDWQGVGTLGLRFQQAIVALLGSRKLDEFFGVVVAQLRLAFSETGDEARFEERWLERTRKICDLICSGDRAQAVLAFGQYLADSEREVLDLVRRNQHAPKALRPRARAVGKPSPNGGDAEKIRGRRPPGRGGKKPARP
jgi:DNA-binding GntR family transcriptional regulator